MVSLCRLTQASPSDEDDSEPGRPLPERLVTELTAHRTLALREALANNPDVAFVAVLHALALRAFFGQQSYDPGSCLEIEAKSSALSGAGFGATLGATSAAQALARMHEAWGIQLPKKPASSGLASGLRCGHPFVAVRPLRRADDQRHAPILRSTPLGDAHATQLAEALSLDMSARWSATKENYLGRVPKRKSSTQSARQRAAQPLRGSNT